MLQGAPRTLPKCLAVELKPEWPQRREELVARGDPQGDGLPPALISQVLSTPCLQHLFYFSQNSPTNCRFKTEGIINTASGEAGFQHKRAGSPQRSWLHTGRSRKRRGMTSGLRPSPFPPHGSVQPARPGCLPLTSCVCRSPAHGGCEGS